jgi:hypothetical protein
MPLDPWLPVNFKLPDGSKARSTIYSGLNWQIVETTGDRWALIATRELAARWSATGLIQTETLLPFSFGATDYVSLSSSMGHTLAPVEECKSPSAESEALAFANALKATREIDKETPLHDAIYVEAATRLLPTHTLTPRLEDDVVLGRWLTGGAPVSVNSFRRLSSILGWLSPAALTKVVQTAGFVHVPKVRARLTIVQGEANKAPDQQDLFSLPGRPELEAFINEHIVDIVQNPERYEILGIGFPSATILHGPPGCGKTFAVERLIEFLEWPNFQIDASSVASPYIHETSRKVADIFERAIESAPSVLVIDEMEAFLADREMGAGSGHHRVEEVAEFLRRIPEATKSKVLVIAMTNRIDMIDPAILRRGRFDHIIKLDYATEEETLSLLNRLLSEIPTEDDIKCTEFAKALRGRPLSDVAFVVREGARLAARSGKKMLDFQSLLEALRTTSSRIPAETPKIGFRAN